MAGEREEPQSAPARLVPGARHVRGVAHKPSAFERYTRTRAHCLGGNELLLLRRCFFLHTVKYTHMAGRAGRAYLGQDRLLSVDGVQERERTVGDLWTRRRSRQAPRVCARAISSSVGQCEAPITNRRHRSIPRCCFASLWRSLAEGQSERALVLLRPPSLHRCSLLELDTSRGFPRRLLCRTTTGTATARRSKIQSPPQTRSRCLRSAKTSRHPPPRQHLTVRSSSN